MNSARLEVVHRRGDGLPVETQQLESARMEAKAGKNPLPTAMPGTDAISRLAWLVKMEGCVVPVASSRFRWYAGVRIVSERNLKRRNPELEQHQFRRVCQGQLRSTALFRLTRVRSVFRISYVNRVGEDPQRPAVPTGKTRLAKIRFRTVTTGTGQGNIERVGFLICDFLTVAKNAENGTTCPSGSLDVKHGSGTPDDRLAGSGRRDVVSSRPRRGDDLRKAVRRIERINRAKGISEFDRVQDDVGAGVIRIDSGLVAEQNVLARQAEHRKIAGKFRDVVLTDDDVCMRVRTADAGNRTLL